MPYLDYPSVQYRPIRTGNGIGLVQQSSTPVDLEDMFDISYKLSPIIKQQFIKYLQANLRGFRKENKKVCIVIILFTESKVFYR